MSASIERFVVVLEQDLSEEAAEQVAQAIRQLRGVLSVESGPVDLMTIVGRRRAEQKLGKAVWDFLYPEKT